MSPHVLIILATLAALVDARRYHRRHHRHSRNLEFHSNYKLFLTIWNRMFEGTMNFEKEKGEVLEKYKKKLRKRHLEDWVDLNICMDGGVPPSEVQRSKTSVQVFEDSRRFLPDWEGQGILPDPFDHPIEAGGKDGVCKRESYSQNYGKHLRRIERVAMVIDSLDKGPDYAYAQSYYDVVAVCYFAGVRCKDISPEMAEAAAFALVRYAVERGMLTLNWMHKMGRVNDILLREVIGDLAPKDDTGYAARTELALGSAATLLGARPLDVQYFADVLQFGDYAPLFAVVHHVFMDRARLAARQKRFLFGRAKQLVTRMEGGEYDMKEVRSTYRQAVRYFKANRERLARAVK